MMESGWDGESVLRLPVRAMVNWLLLDRGVVEDR